MKSFSLQSHYDTSPLLWCIRCQLLSLLERCIPVTSLLERVYTRGSYESEHVSSCIQCRKQRTDTIANLTKASRTEYTLNQIGQFWPNEIGIWIVNNTFSGSRLADGEKGKWFNSVVALSRPSHQGEKPFSISLSLLIKLSIWVRRRVAVRDGSTWDGKRSLCSREGEGTKAAAASRCASSRYENTSEGWEGSWQARCWIAFSRSPAVHTVCSPLPRGHMMVCMWCSHGCWCAALTHGCSRNRFCLQNLPPDCRCP